jgi:hypothetical protein
MAGAALPAAIKADDPGPGTSARVVSRPASTAAEAGPDNGQEIGSQIGEGVSQ